MTLSEAATAALEWSSELSLAKDRIDQAAVNVARAWALVLPTWNASLSYTRRAPEPPTLTFPAFPDLGSAEVQAACRDPADPSMLAPSEACFVAVLDEFNSARNAPGMSFDFARADTINLSSQVTWTVFNGRFFAAHASAEDGVELERARLEAGRTAVVVAVARSYYAALATQRSKEVAERAAGRARAKLSVERARAGAGQESRSRLVAAEIHLREAELDVERARNAHQRTLLALGFAAGLGPGFDVAPRGPIEVASGDELRLVEAARASRPEVRAAARSLMIAERERDDFLWKLAPTLALFGAFRASNVEGITGQKTEWTFGANANWVLFDAGLRYAERDEAEARLSSARHSEEKLLRAISNEIRAARLALEGARISRARAEVAVELARATLDVAEQQHAAGTIREIDLREAVDGVADTELSVVRADFDRDLAALDLAAALGTVDALLSD
ncbi:MAG: TolC family protein [Deltaproteobacteria bacterium]|nr:TolC family protein [Deltaproteobacteria bacterium]